MIALYLTTFTYKLLLTKVIHKDVIHKAFIFFYIPLLSSQMNFSAYTQL